MHKAKSSRWPRLPFLYFAFLLILVVMGSMVVFALERVSILNERTVLIQQLGERSQALHRMRDAVRERFIRLNLITLSEDPFLLDELRIEFDLFASRFMVARAHLDGYSFRTSQEMALFEELRGMTTHGAPILQTVLDAALAGDHTHARTLLIEQAMPVQGGVMTQMDRIFEYFEAHNSRSLDEMEQELARTHWAIWVLAIIQVLLVLLIANWVIQRTRLQQMEMHQEIDRRERSEQDLQLAKDELEQRVKDRTADLNRFKSTLDQTLDCVFMFDASSLHFFYTNEGALLQVGYSREELLTMHPYDIKPDIAESQFRELIVPLLSGELPSLTFETVHQHRHGQRIPVEIFLQYMAPEGEPARFVAIVRDISERKAAEQALRENEQRFRDTAQQLTLATEVAQLGVWDLNLVNGRLDWDAGMFRIYGMEEQDFGHAVEDWSRALLPECLDQATADFVQGTAQPGIPYESEFRIRRADGQIRHIRAMAQAIPGPDGQAEQVIGINEDITARKQAETALVEQAQHTQAILDNMVDGIITIDAHGVMQSFNPAATRIFGYTDGEVLGKNVSMLMPSPHREAHDGYLRNYQSTSVARIIGIGREVEGQRKDGSLFPMELAVSEITQQGQPQYVGMVRDISERKHMERLKSEFVSTVSHELRTPLTSISGALGLITGGGLGELPEQAQQMIAIAHKNSQRLTHLINDLLDMEKIAAGKLHFEMQVQPLMPLIAQALDSHRTYGADQQVELLLDGTATDVEVRVDSQRLQQVLANLLSNAIKFSPGGGMVRISVQPMPGQVRVTVADQGPGIPEEFRSRIFEKFSQADSSDTRQKGGTGLGLAITRELVERMGGRIGFDSVEGEGASFWFELPLLGGGRSSSVIEGIPSALSNAPRILVVEDEPDVAEVLAALLIRSGYRVDVAHTGEQALAALANTVYDALSLDLMLPDISGLDIIRRLRQQPHTASLPIMVVSAKMEEGRLAINGDFSSIEWLAKPIDERRLLETTEVLLGASTSTQPRVLHVEDDTDLHQVIRTMVGGRFDFELATSLREARERIALERFDVVILDIGLPDGSGWDLLPEIRARQPEARVLILSGTDMVLDEARKVEAVLLKSQVSPRALLDALSRRIHHQPRRNET